MNPLLIESKLPDFSAIKPDHIEEAIDLLLTESRACLAQLLDVQTPRTWEALIKPWLRQSEKLAEAWSPVDHLHMVKDSDDLRCAYERCVMKISNFHNEVGLNPVLYQAVKVVQENGGLSQVQQKVLDDMIRDFQLSGVALNETDKESFRQNKQRMTQLATQFSNNAMDATDAWSALIEDANQLKGLPASAKNALAENAKRKDQSGWLLQLDFPSYMPVITYADDRSLRQTIYEAFVTRASDQGPMAGQYDNSAIMIELLQCRQTQAESLGLKNHAVYSLATKMAADASEVSDFLERLYHAAVDSAHQDIQQLEAFAAEQGVTDLQAWDIAYFSEKLREQQFQLSEELLRPYFPLASVLKGMLEITERLFAVKFVEKSDVSTWHKDVQYFEVLDQAGELRASFYLDAYARQKKQSGAWMDVCRSLHDLKAYEQKPVAYLNCNFQPPADGKPSLLRHDDVITLFHEFGHGLHHMMTRQNIPPVSGISGVEWDAVELPSQFMENYCWDKEALDTFARHYETGESLPENLFDKMIQARHFQSGLFLLRQLEFASFDMALHQQTSFTEEPNTVLSMMNQVRDSIAVVPYNDWNRMPNTFGHIFGGGYAAGYYSYLWAELLSADAFAAFEESGLFNTETGMRYCREILEVGGARKAAESFRAFRGRDPEIGPLLKSYGIAA